MTTKAYHQWHHRNVAHRKFAKVQSKWLHDAKHHEYTCKDCKAVLPSLKKVFEHECPGKAAEVPAQEKNGGREK